MEITVKKLSETSGFTLNYIFKILRLSGIDSRIILNNDELLSIIIWLKRNCTTKKRYKLYLIVNSHISCNEVS